MRGLPILCAVTLSGLLLAGCANVAHVERDKNVNFSSYHSYAWVDVKEKENDSSKTKVSDLTERKIKDAVNAELAKTGWRESKNKADVLLSYDVSIERNVRNQSNPVYSQPYTRYYFNPYIRRWSSIYYPSEFLGYDNGGIPLREGTLTITMTDAKTDKTFWQGWTTNEVNSHNLTSKEIQSSVKTIFHKFDVVKN